MILETEIIVFRSGGIRFIVDALAARGPWTGLSDPSSATRVVGCGHPPRALLPLSPMTQIATFAAGCFWGVEAAFRACEGVTETSVGYTGGTTDEPNYQDVCTGETGHAEAVRVEYDSDITSFEQLLDLFWSCHEPTTLNRQGPDVGTQYRSAIFFHDEAQETAAKASRDRLEGSGRFHNPIVTEVVPAGLWHLAEEYHQQYVEKRGGGSCGTR